VHWKQRSGANFRIHTPRSRRTRARRTHCFGGGSRRSERLLNEALEKGSATYESLRKRKDGSLVYVDISCRRGSRREGQLQFYPLHKEGCFPSQSLRDAKLVEARFRNLIESVPTHPHQSILLPHCPGQQQAEKLFGYERGHLLDQPVESCSPIVFAAARWHRTNYFAQPAPAPWELGWNSMAGAEMASSFRRDQPQPAADGRRRSGHERHPRHHERKKAEQKVPWPARIRARRHRYRHPLGEIVLVNSQTEKKLFGTAARVARKEKSKCSSRSGFVGSIPATAVVSSPSAAPLDGAGLELFAIAQGRSEFPVEISLSRWKRRIATACQ